MSTLLARSRPTLGIEVENAQIKIVALTSSGPRARVYRVPFTSTSDRTRDFATGLPEALTAFEREIGLDIRSLPAAVASSHHFSYPSFRAAHDHLVGLLGNHLPAARLAGTDRLHSLGEAASFRPRFVCSRTLGIRTLAHHCGASLAIDCGTTSTETVLVDAAPDIEDPDAYSLERLRDGRLVWVGAIETPLDFLLPSASGWPVVPRMAKLRAVLSLDGSLPLLDQEAAMREVAQAVGLDAELLGGQIHLVAQAFREAAIARLQAAIAPWVEKVHGNHIGLLGLGAPALVRPALETIGITDTRDLEAQAGVPSNFGAACGLALAATLVPMPAGSSTG